MRNRSRPCCDDSRPKDDRSLEVVGSAALVSYSIYSYGLAVAWIILIVIISVIIV